MKSLIKQVWYFFQVLGIAWRRAREGHLPFFRQLAEIYALVRTRNQTIRYYMYGRFWRREMSWEDKLAHFNYEEFATVVDTLNPLPDRKGFGSKLVQKRLLLAAGIPTPPVVAAYSRTLADKELPVVADAAGLERVLNDLDGHRLAFKLISGQGGEGFLSYVVRRQADGTLRLVHPLDGSALSVDDLVARLDRSADGYLIERYLEQHPVVASFNPDSVNTLRIWVRADAGHAGFLASFLRIGRQARMVDNTSAGGAVVCRIGDDGRVIETSLADLSRDSIQAHPDHGAAITGVRLPYYDEAKELALRALRALPGMGFAGVDVAISNQGPAIIEVNLLPAQIGCTRFDIPGKRLFPDIFDAERGNRA